MAARICIQTVGTLTDAHMEQLALSAIAVVSTLDDPLCLATAAQSASCLPMAAPTCIHGLGIASRALRALRHQGQKGQRPPRPMSYKFL
mmetsp:Transcript_61251/g.99158  ORF Transcript_61251/g.99158 Transcript_61251/m.99158 type:complete len:89 (-) Transcript_61251:1234-1500(-)